MGSSKSSYYNLLLIFLCCCYLNGISIFPRSKSDSLTIPYSGDKIIVDGKIDEWETFFKYSFEDTSNTFRSYQYKDLSVLYPKGFDFSEIKKPKSRNRVIVQSFWNNNSINFAITVYDKQLFAEIKSEKDKPKIHLNDGIEIYIDSRDDSGKRMDINDYQFQVNILNNKQVFRGDRHLIALDDIAVPKEFDQNVLFKSAVSISGTINNPTDIDSFYVVEIEIPFASIGIEPKTSHKLRLDVAVNDIDYPAKNSVYIGYASTNMWTFDWEGYNDLGYPGYWKHIVLSGEPSWIENLSEEYRNSWPYIFFITFFVTIIILFWLINRIRKLKKLPTQMDLDGKNVVLIHSDGEEHLSQYQKILANASDFILTNRRKNLRSEDVAKGIGIGLRNFQRITKEELNITPTSFIYIIKLKLAAEFLLKREGNVTEAAFEFGFSDPSYFSKLFKHHFGKSPSEYLHNREVPDVKSGLSKI